MSTSLWISCILIALGFAIILGISYKNTRSLLFNPPENRVLRYEAEPEKHPAQKFELNGLSPRHIELSTEDDVRINAWHIPSSAGASVILLHGYKMDSGEMASIAAILVRHGFGVIVPDLRAHGESEGELITFGSHEWRDIRAVVNYVSEQEPDTRLGILGNSMGGALSLCYAARDARIEAVVAQSPYASVRHSLAQGIKYFTGLPPFPFVPLIRMFSLPYVDLDAPHISPLRMMEHLHDKPVLILMGGADEVVNPKGAEQLHAAGGPKTQYWYESELEHVAFHREQVEEFERRIVEFFRTTLLAPQREDNL
jgi:alpha-beta hydrolase superfamily lysophospholipase